jgi:hypothetical protein
VCKGTEEEAQTDVCKVVRCTLFVLQQLLVVDSTLDSWHATARQQPVQQDMTVAAATAPNMSMITAMQGYQCSSCRSAAALSINSKPPAVMLSCSPLLTHPAGVSVEGYAAAKTEA